MQEACYFIMAIIKLAKSFWDEAMVTSVYLVNRCPSSAIEFKTPEKKWSSRPTDLHHLKVFGCSAYVHQSQGKLEPRAIIFVFLGYPQGTKEYRLWVSEGNDFKIINSRDVIFNETIIPCQSCTDPNSSVVSVYNLAENLENIIQVEPTIHVTPSQALGQSNSSDHEDQDVQAPDQITEPSNHTDQEQGNYEQEITSHSNSEQSLQQRDYILTRDREKRVSRPLQRYGFSA